MNIEIANRLVELRKKSGLSQEELAAKLGLSRQAVSKWERAEASPDTDNLICLAKLYGVSLDRLLDTDQSVDQIVDEQVKPQAEDAKAAQGSPKEDKPQDKTEAKPNEDKTSAKGSSEFHMGNGGIHFKDDGDEGRIDSTGIHVFSKDGSQVHIDNSGIHVSDKDGTSKDVHGSFCCEVKDEPKRGWYLAQSVVSGTVAILAITAYVLCGLLIPDHYIGWGVCWLILLAIPLVSSFVEALHHKKFCAFAVPVLVAGIYVMLGMVFHLWSTAWPIFFAIPLYYIIFGPIDGAISHYRHRDCGININVSGKPDDDDVIDAEAEEKK